MAAYDNYPTPIRFAGHKSIDYNNSYYRLGDHNSRSRLDTYKQRDKSYKNGKTVGIVVHETIACIAQMFVPGGHRTLDLFRLRSHGH